MLCRTPAHCIEYAHLIQWSQQRQGEEFDTDNEEHMRWGAGGGPVRQGQTGSDRVRQGQTGSDRVRQGGGLVRQGQTGWSDHMRTDQICCQPCSTCVCGVPDLLVIVTGSVWADQRLSGK